MLVWKGILHYYSYMKGKKIPWIILGAVIIILWIIGYVSVNTLKISSQNENEFAPVLLDTDSDVLFKKHVASLTWAELETPEDIIIYNEEE